MVTGDKPWNPPAQLFGLGAPGLWVGELLPVLEFMFPGLVEAMDSLQRITDPQGCSQTHDPTFVKKFLGWGLNHPTYTKA